MPPSLISEIIAPATMIPACGLLLLSSTARMNTVLARIRAFHHERLDVWALDAPAGSRRAAVRELRLEGLDHQTARLLRRAGLLRLTMLFLLIAVVCNLGAMLGLGVRFVLENESAVLHSGVSVVFVLGLLAIGVAMVTSFLEVFAIHETVRYEHDRVAALCEAGSAEPSLSSQGGEGTGL